MLKVVQLTNISQYNTEDLQTLLGVIYKHPCYAHDVREAEVNLVFADFKPKRPSTAPGEFGLCSTRSWSNSEKAGNIRRIQLITPTVFQPSDIEILATAFVGGEVPRNWWVATARAIRQIIWRDASDYQHDYKNKTPQEVEKTKAFLAEIKSLRVELSKPTNAQRLAAETNYAIKESAVLKEIKNAEFELKSAAERLKQLEAKRQVLSANFEKTITRLGKQK